MLDGWIAVKPHESWTLVKFCLGGNRVECVDEYWWLIDWNGDSILGLGYWNFCDLYVIIIGKMTSDCWNLGWLVSNSMFICLIWSRNEGENSIWKLLLKSGNF